MVKQNQTIEINRYNARYFEKLGYIGRGLKEGRANTFYITQEGCRFLKGEKHDEK